MLNGLLQYIDELIQRHGAPRLSRFQLDHADVNEVMERFDFDNVGDIRAYVRELEDRELLESNMIANKITVAITVKGYAWLDDLNAT